MPLKLLLSRPPAAGSADPVGGHRLELRGGTYTNAALEGEVGAVLGRF